MLQTIKLPKCPCSDPACRATQSVANSILAIVTKECHGLEYQLIAVGGALSALTYNGGVELSAVVDMLRMQIDLLSAIEEEQHAS